MVEEIVEKDADYGSSMPDFKVVSHIYVLLYYLGVATVG
jgi:hypothetical protein